MRSAISEETGAVQYICARFGENVRIYQVVDASLERS
jgi:hypothetical protein